MIKKLIDQKAISTGNVNKLKRRFFHPKIININIIIIKGAVYQFKHIWLIFRGWFEVCEPSFYTELNTKRGRSVEICTRSEG